MSHYVNLSSSNFAPPPPAGFYLVTPPPNAPVLALAQPVAMTHIFHPQGGSPHFLTQTPPLLARRTSQTSQGMSEREHRAEKLIYQGIENIKQGEIQQGILDFENGYKLLPDGTFITRLLSCWHRIVVEDSQESVLRNAETRLNQNRDDPSGRFVKALCCVKPGSYSLAIFFLKEILEIFPSHPLTKELLATVQLANNRSKSPTLTPAMIREKIAIQRFLKPT